MPKFRKIPVVIEAVQCRDALRAFCEDWKSLPSWLEKVYNGGGVVPTDRGVYLPTLEGSMLAQPDDWIICGVNGEVYPCKPDIFEKTYEPADDEAAAYFTWGKD
jgi:hypothetical protein